MNVVTWVPGTSTLVTGGGGRWVESAPLFLSFGHRVSNKVIYIPIKDTNTKDTLPHQLSQPGKSRGRVGMKEAATL